MPKEPVQKKTTVKSRSENLFDPPAKKSPVAKKTAPAKPAPVSKPNVVEEVAPPVVKTVKKSAPKAKKTPPAPVLETTPTVPASLPDSGSETVSAAVREFVQSAEAPVVTTIEVRYDAGFGNTLFLRGEGAGLSWEKGVALANVAPDQWTYTLEGAAGELLVKVLLNDILWCAGANVEVPVGQKTVITPVF